jgi:hypothetical protein
MGSQRNIDAATTIRRPLRRAAAGRSDPSSFADDGTGVGIVLPRATGFPDYGFRIFPFRHRSNFLSIVTRRNKAADLPGSSYLSGLATRRRGRQDQPALDDMPRPSRMSVAPLRVRPARSNRTDLNGIRGQHRQTHRLAAGFKLPAARKAAADNASNKR